MRYYNSDVHLLDLCIFSYHLHAQTLIWPMDPYYEQMELMGAFAAEKRREIFMKKVREKTTKRTDLHGPASCQGDLSSGWPSNEFLEPIISDYSRIYPWRPSFTRPEREKAPWVVYNTPSRITDSINVVKMFRYDTNAGPYKGASPTVQVDPIHDSRPQNLSSLPNATELLYCFEGGTGAIGGGETTQKQYPLWSIMGFALTRTVTDVELDLRTKDVKKPKPVSYDIYIVFRGSRSGELRKWEAGAQKMGNPDWVTDWDLFTLIGDADISERGKVCRGFGTSIKTMLPTVVKALEQIAAEKRIKLAVGEKEQPPRYIYVTGHSLGAALACHFTSALLCGTKYGPNGAGDAMPDSLKEWPWETVRLVTYSSPVVGNAAFRDNFNKTIQSRRIWLDGDVITQEQINCLVGEACQIRQHDEKTFETKTVIVPTNLMEGEIIQKNYHEPFLLRRNVIISWIKDRADAAAPTTTSSSTTSTTTTSTSTSFSRLMAAAAAAAVTVPAGIAQEDKDEPMKYFDHCADMVLHLEKLQKALKLPLSALFPDFIANCEFYLQIFREWEPELSASSTNAKANKLKGLMTNLNALKNAAGPASWKTLGSYWRPANVIQTDEAFYDFIGLCFFLANVSKGFGSGGDLSNLIDAELVGEGKEKAFADLLKTKI